MDSLRRVVRTSRPARAASVAPAPEFCSLARGRYRRSCHPEEGLRHPLVSRSGSLRAGFCPPSHRSAQGVGLGCGGRPPPGRRAVRAVVAASGGVDAGAEFFGGTSRGRRTDRDSSAQPVRSGWPGDAGGKRRQLRTPLARAAKAARALRQVAHVNQPGQVPAVGAKPTPRRSASGGLVGRISAFQRQPLNDHKVSSYYS
jgi:hypothetical protein